MDNQEYMEIMERLDFIEFRQGLKSLFRAGN